MAISDFQETIFFVEKKKVSDGLGGTITEYVRGLEFQGVIQRQSTQEQILAQQMGLGEVWILITSTNIDLDRNDYVEYNGMRFKVVTDELKQPPKTTIKTHQYQLSKEVV